MVLDQGTRDNTDVVVFGQFAVSVKVGTPLPTPMYELWVFRYPARQMVFGQHGEVSPKGGGGGNVFGSFLVVALDLKGLGRMKGRGKISGGLRRWECLDTLGCN